MHIRNLIDGTPFSDFFNLSGLDNADIFGGRGNDRLFGNNLDNCFIDLGIGNDTVIASNSDGLTIKDRSGNNTAIANDIEDLLVTFGAGRDIFRGTDINGGVIKMDRGADTALLSYADGVVLHMGDGADIASVIHGSGVKVYGGNDDASDTLYFEHSSKSNLTDMAGDNKVTIVESDRIRVTFGDGDDQVKVDGGERHRISTGEGDDEVTVVAPASKSFYDLGRGDNIFRFETNKIWDTEGVYDLGTIKTDRNADSQNVLIIDQPYDMEGIAAFTVKWDGFDPYQDRVQGFDEGVIDGDDITFTHFGHDGIFTFTVEGAGVEADMWGGKG